MNILRHRDTLAVRLILNADQCRIAIFHMEKYENKCNKLIKKNQNCPEIIYSVSRLLKTLSQKYSSQYAFVTNADYVFLLACGTICLFPFISFIVHFPKVN